MKLLLLRYLADRSGATVVEYALIAGFIALGCIVGLTAAGQEVLSWYESIRDGL